MGETKGDSSDNKKYYTLDEISKHNSEGDCWMIIGNLKNGASLRHALWPHWQHMLVVLGRSYAKRQHRPEAFLPFQ